VHGDGEEGFLLEFYSHLIYSQLSKLFSLLAKTASAPSYTQLQQLCQTIPTTAPT